MSIGEGGQSNAGAKGGLPVVEFEVSAGRRYRFQIGATDEQGHEGPRGLVGKLEFLDESGQRMDVAAEGCAHTDRHGPVVYLPTQLAEGMVPLASENLVIAPEGASRVRVRIRSWKSSPAVMIVSPLAMIAEREPALASYEFPVKGGIPHSLEMTLQSAVWRARAAILTVEYFDDTGALVPGAYDECISSPRFGQFRYLRAITEGAALRVPIHPPAHAVRVRLAILPWQAGMDDLAVIGEPRLEVDLPEGLDASEWTLLSEKAWSEPQPLGERCSGLLHVTLDCLGLLRQEGPDPKVLVDFVDSAGLSLAVPDGAATDARTIVVGLPLKLARRGGFFQCPPGAAGIRLRLDASGHYALLARKIVEVDHVPQERLPENILDPLGAGQSVSQRHAVSSLWSVRVEFDAFAVEADNRHLDLGLGLLDSAGKPINPKGILLEASHANAVLKGNVLSVTPHAMASGTQGMVRFSTVVRILPPRGAATLVTTIANPRTQGVMVAACVRAYEVIEEERLVPESIPELLAMDEDFPGEVCRLAEKYLQWHGEDPWVLTHLLDAYRRFGEMEKMEAVARMAIAKKGPKLDKLHTKARHALAQVCELDPDWLPVAGLGGPVTNASPDGAGLRVAHLFKTTVPVENTGGAIRCLNIVNFQRKLGMRPMVVTPLGYPDAGGTGSPWEKELIDGVPYFRLNGVGRQVLRSVTCTTQLEYTAMLTARLLGEQGVDIVQASSGYRGYEQALVGLAVSRALQVPFVYEVRSYHEHTWRGMTHWLLEADHTRRRFEQENRCMREADAVVTICETMKQGLVERGIPADKIFVVPNSVDLAKFHEAEPDPELRARLGLGEDLVAGYISNVSAREGHHVLLRAVAHCRGAGIGMKCLIVGAGPEVGKLRSLAADLGIAEHVVFTGEVAHEQVPGYYAMIDLFVIPRVADFASDFVTPMKPFEAMAMRRPLVVSDRPALLEIVGANGERGSIFRTGDHLDLAARLIELAGSPEKREMLAQQGRRWIEAERSWDRTIRIYDQVYAHARQNVEPRTASKPAGSP